eukprot:GILJ01002234.1.p1 GENE.GILJ01002234.1~~GILJ01002234.1.p1  ORF type:complete len:753 (+),score=149.31 GILJ01002234.1:255-2261(+)
MSQRESQHVSLAQLRHTVDTLQSTVALAQVGFAAKLTETRNVLAEVEKLEGKQQATMDALLKFRTSVLSSALPSSAVLEQMGSTASAIRTTAADLQRCTADVTSKRQSVSKTWAAEREAFSEMQQALMSLSQVNTELRTSQWIVDQAANQKHQISGELVQLQLSVNREREASQRQNQALTLKLHELESDFLKLYTKYKNWMASDWARIDPPELDRSILGEADESLLEFSVMELPSKEQWQAMTESQRSQRRKALSDSERQQLTVLELQWSKQDGHKQPQPQTQPQVVFPTKQQWMKMTVSQRDAFRNKLDLDGKYELAMLQAQWVKEMQITPPSPKPSKVDPVISTPRSPSTDPLAEPTGSLDQVLTPLPAEPITPAGEAEPEPGIDETTEVISLKNQLLVQQINSAADEFIREVRSIQPIWDQLVQQFDSMGEALDQIKSQVTWTATSDNALTQGKSKLEEVRASIVKQTEDLEHLRSVAANRVVLLTPLSDKTPVDMEGEHSAYMTTLRQVAAMLATVSEDSPSTANSLKRAKELLNQLLTQCLKDNEAADIAVGSAATSLAKVQNQVESEHAKLDTARTSLQAVNRQKELLLAQAADDPFSVNVASVQDMIQVWSKAAVDTNSLAMEFLLYEHRIGTLRDVLPPDYQPQDDAHASSQPKSKSAQE